MRWHEGGSRATRCPLDYGKSLKGQLRGGDGEAQAVAAPLLGFPPRARQTTRRITSGLVILIDRNLDYIRGRAYTPPFSPFYWYRLISHRIGRPAPPLPHSVFRNWHRHLVSHSLRDPALSTFISMFIRSVVFFFHALPFFLR